MWVVCSDANGRVALVGDNAPISARVITERLVTLMGMSEPIIITMHDTLESADNHALRISA